MPIAETKAMDTVIDCGRLGGNKEGPLTGFVRNLAKVCTLQLDSNSIEGALKRVSR